MWVRLWWIGWVCKVELVRLSWVRVGWLGVLVRCVCQVELVRWMG